MLGWTYRSSSSFFLMAYELEEPFAALISSSARHSAMLLTFLKLASLAPMVNRAMAWLTLLSGDTSTACLRTVPADPIRVESSRGPQLTIASTATWIGFWSVIKWMMEKAWSTMRTACSFLPLLRPFIMSELVRRSIIGHWALRKRFMA